MTTTGARADRLRAGRNGEKRGRNRDTILNSRPRRILKPVNCYPCAHHERAHG
jgi:hypothetical protein